MSLILVELEVSTLPSLKAEAAFIPTTKANERIVLNQNINVYHNFGTLTVFDPIRADHIFMLQNNGQRPIAIIELRPTCGCTRASIEDGGTSLPLVLQPGQSLPVRITVDLTLLPPGPFSKSVWVLVQGQDAPRAILTLTGMLLPTARFSAEKINFGRVSVGNSAPHALTVHLAANLLPAGSHPRLTCSNLDVQIAPEPVAASDEKREQSTSITPDRAKTSFSQSYCLNLTPKAHLGQINGNVSVVVTVPGQKAVTIGSIPLQGEVVGDVAASPSLIAFGTVTAGKAATQQILLTTQGTQTLGVSCASPFLSASLHLALAGLNRPFSGIGANTKPLSHGNTPNLANSPKMQLLDITLSLTTPVGPLETSLTVTTGSGQQLVIAVYASVQKPMEQGSAR